MVLAGKHVFIRNWTNGFLKNRIDYFRASSLPNNSASISIAYNLNLVLPCLSLAHCLLSRETTQLCIFFICFCSVLFSFYKS